MSSMGKGQIWVNGQCIGRYWPAYTASGDCSACSYAGTYNEKKCVTNCGDSTQKWSVLVLNGNGTDVAKHCVRAVPTKWISITFRKMESSKWPIGFALEPDLQTAVAFPDDSSHQGNRHVENSRSSNSPSSSNSDLSSNSNLKPSSSSSSSKGRRRSRGKTPVIRN